MDFKLGHQEGKSLPSPQGANGSIWSTSTDKAKPGRNGRHQEETLLIIDERALRGECLAQSLKQHGLGMDVAVLGSMEEWRREWELHPPLAAILLDLGGRLETDDKIGEQITRLTSEFRAVPVVILADTDDLAQILKALEHGARGFIPTSVGIDVCVEAIALAVSGGIFVPASSVLAMRHLIDAGRSNVRPLSSMFTTRQAEVVLALRKGKANKIIAYELNMRECTVKVHVRNIMRKLKATNRTEVAYKINELFPM